jgi:putative transposase
MSGKGDPCGRPYEIKTRESSQQRIFMPFDPHKHHRQSNRLKNFNYSSPGAYFVTICTNIRGRNTFGEITTRGLECNAAGIMILEVWNSLAERFPIILDEFVVMPDHVHGIIILQNIVGAGLVPALRTDETSNQETQILGVIQENDHFAQRATIRVAPTKNPILGDVVGAFKSITTNRYIKGVRELGWESFEKRLWERDYNERILRNDIELEQKRNYILENPIRSQVKAGLV